MDNFYLWAGFLIAVIILLIVDLAVFNKKAHEVKVKESLLWSAFWIGLALLFNVFIYYYKGPKAAMEYFTAYFIEKSLSMDNLFVFLMIFTFFKVPLMYQHRVLFWGILGALIMRFIFIFAGVVVINQFEWTLYIFGAILIWSAWKMVVEKDKEVHPDKNPVIKLFRKIMPVTPEFDNGHFFTKIHGKKLATPLFVALLLIESSDVVFAVDSIPAVLAISRDTFIIYSSNIMAILGLRALYFALSAIMVYFRFLNYGLAVILAFVGVKMLIMHWVHIPPMISLIVVFSVLLLSIFVSMMLKDKPKPE